MKYLLLLLLFTSCSSFVQDSNYDIKKYYVKVLAGEVGCMPKDIITLESINSSGFCGSIDVIKISCKNTKYICTMSSAISSETIDVAGITQSHICKTSAKCSKEVQ